MVGPCPSPSVDRRGLNAGSDVPSAPSRRVRYPVPAGGGKVFGKFFSDLCPLLCRRTRKNIGTALENDVVWGRGLFSFDPSGLAGIDALVTVTPHLVVVHITSR